MLRLTYRLVGIKSVHETESWCVTCLSRLPSHKERSLQELKDAIAGNRRYSTLTRHLLSYSSKMAGHITESLSIANDGDPPSNEAVMTTARPAPRKQ
ncbi:unnamed protein product [Leptosia nina]|uniref:Uncharacterized protein n=1 Tax=Leptosia nina TaxID=320188 RepID=A0AAV1J3U0_9NEOP